MHLGDLFDRLEERFTQSITQLYFRAAALKETMSFKTQVESVRIYIYTYLSHPLHFVSFGAYSFIYLFFLSISFVIKKEFCIFVIFNVIYKKVFGHFPCNSIKIFPFFICQFFMLFMLFNRTDGWMGECMNRQINKFPMFH